MFLKRRNEQLRNFHTVLHDRWQKLFWFSPVPEEQQAEPVRHTLLSFCVVSGRPDSTPIFTSVICSLDDYVFNSYFVFQYYLV